MNRRQFLTSSAAVTALSIVPFGTVASTLPTAFVPPTNNIVHLAGRIGQKCLFTSADVLQILGLDPTQIVVDGEDKKSVKSFWDEDDLGYRREHYAPVDQARLLAQDGDHDIYKRAQMVIDIKRKMNLHFDFSHDEQVTWLDRPNQHLGGRAFREVMKEDLLLATEVVDLALQA